MKSTSFQSGIWTFSYQSQASEWFDGIPLGNGDLGALMMASQRQIRFPLAKSDLWEERCDDGTGKPGSFYPFESINELRSLLERGKWDQIEQTFDQKRAKWKGNFALLSAGALVLDTSRFEKEIEQLDFRRGLDMRTGVANNGFLTRVRKQHVEALVSVEHEVLAIHVRCVLDWRKGDPPRRMTFGMDIGLHREPDSGNTKVTTETSGRVLRQVVRRGSVTYTTAVAVAGAGVRVISDRKKGCITVTSSGQADFVIYLALARGHESSSVALARVKQASSVGYQSIKQRHRQWWRKFWLVSSISIPDEKMLRQYHFGLYLLASSSRRGFQMPGLQGLWYTRSPGTKWNEYTNDLNIQMNYWPIYTSNHLELGWPYYDTVRRWLPEARKYTRRYWRCNGVQFSCCASPTGIVPPAYLTTMHWAGSAAFVAQNFWTHYLYSRDEEFLRKIAYPFLKECAEFYIDFLKLDERGLYEVWPSNNPEASEGSYEAWGKNPTMDIALLKMLFAAIVESAKILGSDEDFSEKCRHRLERLPPYPMRGGALIDMESKEFIYSHRHNGIITPIYPCADMDGKVAEKTIERFMERGRWLWGCHTVPWQAAAYARVGGGEKAYELLAEMFESYFPPHGGFNLNYNYQRRVGGIIGPAVFCNESNSGFCAAVLEMLLQSHRGIIYVFPGVPFEWKDIAIKNLRAVGAFLISATRRNGSTTQVEICSTKGGTLRVKNPWRTLPNVVCDGKIVNIMHKRDALMWETKPESSYLIQPHV